jgi:hypothetical protein
MTSYRSGVWITTIVAGALAISVAAFATAFGLVLVETLLTAPFNMSLTSGASSMSTSFTIYGFIAIEATFVGIVLYFGITTINNALRRRVLELEVSD